MKGARGLTLPVDFQRHDSGAGVDSGVSELEVDVLVHDVRGEVMERHRKRNRDDFHVLVIPSVEAR